MKGTKSIPCRQKCAACFHIMPIDYHVTDEIWYEVVPTLLNNSIICLNCFTSWADEKLLPWDKEIEMRPTSLHTQRYIGLMADKEMSEQALNLLLQGRGVNDE